MQRDFLPWHHHPDHPDVVVPVRVDPTGRLGPTPKAARCSGWRPVGAGWFVPGDVDGTQLHQRIVEGATRLTSYGAVTGWAALAWQGGRWFDGGGTRPHPVPLVTGNAGVRSTGAFTISEERVNPDDILVVDGLRVTTPVRSVLYEMRHAPTDIAATIALDMACYDDLVSLDEATTYAGTLGTWTGIPQARKALDLGDEYCWSPAEVIPRIIWTREAGLPRPLTNAPIFDLAGRRVRTPDLIDPVAGVLGEYDGPVHLDREAKRNDVRRDETYRRLGLEYVVFTAPDLEDVPGIVRRLHEAYDRAQRRPVADRQWTTTPPSWWTDVRTVEERRALTPAEQSRYLRYRIR